MRRRAAGYANVHNRERAGVRCRRGKSKENNNSTGFFYSLERVQSDWRIHCCQGIRTSETV